MNSLSPIFEDGWIWGRLARYNVEMKEYDPASHASLSKATSGPAAQPRALRNRAHLAHAADPADAADTADKLFRFAQFWPWRFFLKGS